MSDTRRDKGEGSVYMRKDGAWVAKYKSPKMTSHKYLYAKTEAEAKRKLRAYKLDSVKNDYLEIQKISVREYMDNWFNTVLMNRLKPKSLDIKESILNNQVYPNIGNFQISALTAKDVQAMINTLVEKNYSYSTIKKAYDAVNACFKLGIIRNEVSANPCAGVSLPKNIKKSLSSVRFFTDEEIEKICNISTAKHRNDTQIYRLGYGVILLLYTGLRVGEFLALKWNDVSVENRTINVRNSVVVVKNRDKAADKKFVYSFQDSVKTDSANRIVHLNNKAISAIDELKKLNGSYEYVISTSKGSICSPRNFSRTFSDILRRCNIEPCGVHTLRHTFASLLFRKGVDVRTVSELLGHSDVAITYNIYIHLIKEQKHQAVSLLDEL